MSVPENVGSENDLEKLGAAAPDLVDAVRGGEHPLLRHQDTCGRCFKQIWKVGKIGKVFKVGNVGKVVNPLVPAT
jgi:hypothetical protein